MRKKTIIKCIVPGIVSLETNLSDISGSYLFKNFDFFPNSNLKQKFHYRVIVTKFNIPEKADFRNGYYFRKQDNWYYNRNFGLHLCMRYEPKTKTFYFNKTYMRIPVEIGGILPPGKHIADMIALDLTLAGFCVIRGYSYKQNNQVMAGIRPSLNGKTTIMRSLMQEGAEYIAEDILVIDPKHQYIYPTMAQISNYGRSINQKLYGLAKAHKIIDKQKIDALGLLLSDTRRETSMKDNLIDYLTMNGSLFIDNRFIKAYVFEHSLTKQLKYSSDLFINSNLPFVVDDNLFRQRQNVKHWDSLGSKYEKAWQGLAKQEMSRQELKFITQSIAKPNPTVLDVGVGTGRIIGSLAYDIPRSQIYGLDVAPSMVELCQTKFASVRQVKDISLYDISKTDIPFDISFNAITAIRVLKYNHNWKEIITGLSNKLALEGVLIFSMPNKISINQFGHYHIPFERTSTKEIQDLMKTLGLNIIDIRTFTRIPDQLYYLSSLTLWQNFVMKCESFLKILGKARFGRELFIVVERP